MSTHSKDINGGYALNPVIEAINSKAPIRHVESPKSLLGRSEVVGGIAFANFFANSDQVSGSCLSSEDRRFNSTYKVQVKAGWQAQIGCFNSNVELFVLDGELTQGGFSLRKHSYSHIPAGLAVGPWHAAKDTTLLWMPTGYAVYDCGQFGKLEQTPTKALQLSAAHPNARHYIPVMDIDAMPWEATSFLPPGSARKSLFTDADTGQTTWVLGLVPGWQGGSSAESHPSTEEAYMLRGGIEGYWSMESDPHRRQYGEMKMGGYFFRPAFLQHGPFKSQNGALVLFRTAGQLKVHWSLSS
jgi:hypothetical protein